MRIVTFRWARDAMAAGWRQVTRSPGRNAAGGRRSRVVLAPRPWRLSPPARAGGATVTKKAAHRGEHEVSRKAIVRGKPGCLGCTCQTRVHSFATFSTRQCGRSQRPAFPAPSSWKRDNEIAELRRNRAVRMRAHVSPPSLRGAKRRSNPACRTQESWIASLRSQ